MRACGSTQGHMATRWPPEAGTGDAAVNAAGALYGKVDSVGAEDSRW